MCSAVIQMLCGFGRAVEENWSYASVKWHYLVHIILMFAYISSNILWYIVEELAVTQFPFSMNLDETIYLWRQCPVFNHYLYIDTIKTYWWSKLSMLWTPFGNFKGYWHFWKVMCQGWQGALCQKIRNNLLHKCLCSKCLTTCSSLCHQTLHKVFISMNDWIMSPSSSHNFLSNHIGPRQHCLILQWFPAGLDYMRLFFGAWLFLFLFCFLVGWLVFLLLFFARFALVYHSDLGLCITFPDHSTIQYNIK